MTNRLPTPLGLLAEIAGRQDARIGDTVGFVFPLRHPRAGEVTPAIITRNWNHQFPGDAPTVELMPIINVHNCAEIDPEAHRSVYYDRDKKPGTWHRL
jgi:hypothetical protein